jgi:hypothetical protein
MTPIECLKMLKGKIDAAGLNKCNYVIETSDIEAINEALKSKLGISVVSGSLPFPDDYEDVKYSYLNFMETAMMMDVKMQPMNEIADKTDKATDKFAKYLLRQ